MKLVRFGRRRAEVPGLVDRAGRLRDLSGEIPDLDPAHLAPAVLARLAALDPERLPLVAGDPRLGPPVAGTGKLIGIGLNYKDHAAEAGAKPPAEPIVFLKATSAIAGPHDPLVIPKGSNSTDWEVELGLVIGRRAKHIDRADAFAHIAGYLIVNDVSERDWQFSVGGQWAKGKSCDGFAPIGPYLTTPDEIPDPQNLRLWLEIDGRRRQDGNTADMIFGIAEIVSYLSRFFTLEPGDIIATGTPAGVGMGRKPPEYLRPGQNLRLGIDGLGEQSQRIIAEE